MKTVYSKQPETLTKPKKEPKHGTIKQESDDRKENRHSIKMKEFTEGLSGWEGEWKAGPTTRFFPQETIDIFGEETLKELFGCDNIKSIDFLFGK